MFSIVVPVWNGRRFIRACVRQVIEQSFADWELILVDDGSTDDGFDEIADVDDPRIRIVRRANGGCAAARNTGLEAASADWIAFLDVDDFWTREHLAELDRVRTICPEAGLIGTAYISSDADGRFTLPPGTAAKVELLPYFERFGAEGPPFWISSSAVRRDAWRRLGGFRPSRYGDDGEFLARMALDVPVAASSRVTAVWVHGTGGITDGAAGSRWKGARLCSAADIAPAVATVMERRASSPPAGLPPGIGRFIDRYVGWCLLASYGIADSATIRRLAPLFEHPPGRRERLMLALGRLPPPALKFVKRAWTILKSLPRRVAGRGFDRKQRDAAVGADG